MYKLAKILSFYKNNFNIYIEQHEVENGIIQAGKPLTSKGLKELSELLKGGERESNKSGWIPENVFFHNNKITAWYAPPMKRTLFFEDKEFQAYVPPLIFIARKNTTSVFAVKENHRSKITPEVNLFYAPFPNINYNGEICFGTVKKEYPESCVKRVQFNEAAFFNSRFTHYLTVVTEEVTGQIWEKSMEKPFDLKSLKPLEKKLMSVLE